MSALLLSWPCRLLRIWSRALGKQSPTLVASPQRAATVRVWRRAQSSASHQAKPMQKPTNMSPRRGYGSRVVRRFFPHRAGVTFTRRARPGDVWPRRPMPGTEARAFFGVARPGMLAAGAMAQSAAAWAPGSRPAPGTRASAPGVIGRVASVSFGSAHRAVDTELQAPLSRRVSSLLGALYRSNAYNTP